MIGQQFGLELGEKIVKLEAEVERLKAHTWQQERAAKVHEWILRVAAPHISRNELDEYKAILGEHWPEGRTP